MKSKEEAGKKPTFKPPEKMRKLAELARERADGGRERRQRERALTEGDSTGDIAGGGRV
jgi:hypothetical protein